MSRAVLPSHETKDSARLEHALPSGEAVILHQSQETGSTSTSLWLGSQVLTLYLSELRLSDNKKRAIELGAGTGLCSLELASLGFDVLATDLDDCIARLDACLQENLAAHPHWKGTVSTLALDWTRPLPSEALMHNAELIVSADCVFDTMHVECLLATLSSLCRCSKPLILVALERRDPALVNGFLQKSREAGFGVSQIPKSKLSKLVAAHYGWQKEAWSDVEIWKFKPP